MTDFLACQRQAVVHQLRHAADKIEMGDGVVEDFEYEEEFEGDDGPVPPGCNLTGLRIMDLELTFLLPE